jgi:osmotically-inducible protein OsmY
MRASLQLALAAILLLGASGCRVLREHEGPTAYVGDASINAHVEIALAQSPAVAAQEIDVHTYQGTVTLDGVVDSASMARRAEEITRGTPGVRSVVSRLQVAGATPRPSDPQDTGEVLHQAFRQ